MLLHELIPETKKLADLHLITYDLISVQKMCSRLLKIFKRPADCQDEVLIDALYSALLIRYARCFSGGMRESVNRVVFVKHQGALETHDFYINLRNKLVAHSVNRFEECKISLCIEPCDHELRKVVGISLQSMRLLTHEAEAVQTLVRLAEICLTEINREMQALKQETLVKAKLLTQEQLATLNPVVFTAPEPEEAGRKRS